MLRRQVQEIRHTTRELSADYAELNGDVSRVGNELIKGRQDVDISVREAREQLDLALEAERETRLELEKRLQEEEERTRVLRTDFSR